jgi:hypothetical protein
LYADINSVSETVIEPRVVLGLGLWL